MNYTIEELFQSINDSYAQYDTGKIDLSNSEFLAKKCCYAFIRYLDEKEQNEL